MDAAGSDLLELKELPANLLVARLERGFSQERLARKSRLTQAQISLFESGHRLPALDQFVRLARTLDVPLQRLLTGTDRPGTGLKDLAVELRRLGAVDLWVADAVVPGAARRPEEVIALAVSGSRPDPRVVEALPALLSWNALSPSLLRAYGTVTRTKHRLAWLADVALTIERQKGFPGGCRKEALERFLKRRSTRGRGLGRPRPAGGRPPKFPAWRRWRINYAATPGRFEERARELGEAVSAGGKETLIRRSNGTFTRRRATPPRAASPQKESGPGASAAPKVRRSGEGRGNGG